MGHYKDSCAGKQRYETKADAERHARSLAEIATQEINVYPCFWCKKWHVGRKASGPKRRLDRKGKL